MVKTYSEGFMIVINGAGIAGLTLANALLAKKLAFVIIEKHAEITELGAGIIIQNNGIAILKQLGLFNDFPHYRPEKMVLSRSGVGFEITPELHGLDNIVVHRADLARVLAKNIPTKNFIFNCSIDKLVKSTDGYHVYDTHGQVHQAEHVVNAAGLHSDLHAKAVINDCALWCWRTIVKTNAPIRQSGEFWFGQQRVGIAPLNDNELYLFHVIKHSGKTQQQPSTAERLSWLKSKSSTLPFIKLLALDECTWLFHPLSDRAINWGEGELIAIGDAAHAMTPNLGQGAVLAMEDAMVLANIIADQHNKKSHDGLDFSEPTAERLKKQRQQRVSAMHRNSRNFGWIAHIQNSLLSKTFLFFISILPTSLLIKAQLAWMNRFIQSNDWR